MRVGSSNKKESKPNGPHAPIATHPLLMLKGEWGSEYITFGVSGRGEVNTGTMIGAYAGDT